MRAAMANAEVGDDVYREDPTVNQLQEKAAEIFEREAALFVPSGTMGNQIAVKLHTNPGREVITEARSHIFNYEMATMAALSGCLARPVFSEMGHLSWKDIEPELSPDAYYRAQTGLVTLENTHNFAGGTVAPPENTLAVTTEAHKKGLPVHMDGARIFNAAASTGYSVAKLSVGCDSLMFCLSKALSAPVGSLLVGGKDFIEEAWRIRKMLGGGMRQVGVLAAAGLIALEKMPSRLHEDHDNARILAGEINNIPGLSCDLSRVQTNIVIVKTNDISATELLQRIQGESVLGGWASADQIRFVTHKDVNREGIETAVKALYDVAG